jgi:hypothetical protein
VAKNLDHAEMGLLLYRLLVLLTVLVVPVIVIPLIRTMNPPQHSKELALRFLLPALATAFVLGWPRRSRQPADLAEVALIAFAGAQFLSAAVSGRFLYCLTETWHLWLLPLMAVAIGRARFSPRDLDLLWLVALVSAVLALL